MIQPSALPVIPALMPVATMPMARAGDAGEAGEFAALLGVQLEAAPPPLADLPKPATASANVVPDGKELLAPLLPTATITEEEALDVPESNEMEPTPAALPILQIALTPDVPAPARQDSASPAPEPMPTPPTMTLPPAAAPALPSPRPEGKTPSDTPAAAPLPQPPPAAPEEKPRPAPAEAIRTLAPATQIEAPIAPAATFHPIATTPQVSALPTAQPHARHDFATLVDRLVEARDAALTVQTPQSVAAAVTHSEFGEVSIRFEHRGDALSVSLASADPDFTRAVQAATPAAQANTAGDNGAQPQRQDGSGQQSAASSGNSHQPQSQQRQGTASPRAPIQQDRNGGQKQPANGGIFA